MTTRILAYTFLLFALTILNGCGDGKPYDEKMISDDKEFDYLGSNKRGIRGKDGIVYCVDKDGTSLSAYSGDVAKWKVPFDKACPVPDGEVLQVLYMSLDKNELFLIFGAPNGKHNKVKINIHDGKSRFKCADDISRP